MERIKDLETLLKEGRKHGACSTLSLQSLAQLENIYGKEVAKIIIGNTATKVIFSEYEPEIAEKISRPFGVYEVRETKEGISYGAHEHVTESISPIKQRLEKLFRRLKFSSCPLIMHLSNCREDTLSARLNLNCLIIIR